MRGSMVSAAARLPAFLAATREPGFPLAPPLLDGTL